MPSELPPGWAVLGGGVLEAPCARCREVLLLEEGCEDHILVQERHGFAEGVFCHGCAKMIAECNQEIYDRRLELDDSFSQHRGV